MATALDSFLQLTRRGHPYLARATELRSVEVETTLEGLGPGKAQERHVTRLDFIDGGFTYVDESVQDVLGLLGSMEMDGL